MEDLLALSENCYIDSWSEGGYISLKNDLDLTGIDFNPIPVFSGIFDGGGHTISGFDHSLDYTGQEGEGRKEEKEVIEFK